MKKSFLFNVFFLVFVNLMIKPFWVLGIDRIVQNRLGEQAYGMYFAIFNFTYLFQILLDFGLQNYNNREVAADNSKINELLPSLLLFKTLLLIVYLILCIAFAYPLGYLSYSFLGIMLINQILLSFNIFLRTNVSAHQLFIRDSLLSVLDKLLMILFCAFMIWGKASWFPLSIFNFALAQLAAYFITFIVCLFYSLQLTQRFVFNIQWSRFLQIAKTTLPYALIHFLMTTYYRIDGVMLEQLSGNMGAQESGIYAQSYRLIESLNNIGYLIAGILLPLFAFNLTKKTEINTLLRTGFNIMFCISVSIIVCFFVFKLNIIALMYPHTDAYYSSSVFGILLLNFFPVALLYVIGTLLTANKNFGRMIGILVTAVIINVSLNFYLIHQMGAKGAAFATLITQLFMLIAYGYSVVKIFNLPFDVRYLFRLIAFLILCLLLIFAVQQISFFKSKYTFVIQIGLYFLFVPFISFATGLINKSTLKLKLGVAS